MKKSYKRLHVRCVDIIYVRFPLEVLYSVYCRMEWFFKEKCWTLAILCQIVKVPLFQIFTLKFCFLTWQRASENVECYPKISKTFFSSKALKGNVYFDCLKAKNKEKLIYFYFYFSVVQVDKKISHFGGLKNAYNFFLFRISFLTIVI